MKKLLWIPAVLLLSAGPQADAKFCTNCEDCQLFPDAPGCKDFLQGEGSAEESMWQSMLNAFVVLFS
jgi:hypothetical protein